MSYGVTYYIFTSVFQIFFIIVLANGDLDIVFILYREEDKKSGHFCFNSPYFLRTTINIFFFVEHVRLQIGKHSAGPPTGKRCVFKLDKSKRLTSGVVRQQKNHLFTKYRVINMDLSYSRQLLCVLFMNEEIWVFSD